MDRFRLKVLMFFGLFVACISYTHASLQSPFGNWITVDDNTREEKSIVKLNNVDGEMVGTIEKVLVKDDSKSPYCELCPDDFHNKPILGLQFLWGMRFKDGVWSGGKILDPETGNIYRCKITLSEDGKFLKVRGFIGFSLFGRTQEWKRLAVKPEK